MDTEQDLRFHFTSNGQGSASFDVVELQGEEAISTLFFFEIILVSDSADIDFNAMLKNKATLTINSIDGTKQVPYHGILSRFDQLRKINNYVFYKAVLVPRLWSASLFESTEVYLDEKSVPDTVSKVLNQNNLTSNDFSLALKSPGDYRKRTFVCQYQESDLNFINRSLEHEGIYYYFEHGSGASGTDKLHMTDFKESHPTGTIQLTYCQPEDLDTSQQDACVYNFVATQRPVPKEVSVQDYNYRNAALADGLKATVRVSDHGVGEVMHFGGNLRTVSEAQHLATIRSQEYLSGEKQFSADATAVGIRSGYFVSVDRHYRSSYNAKYLVTRVRHSGTQAGVLLAGESTPYAPNERGITYTASFEAIPAGTQYRPSRTASIPVIPGVLSATVDAEGSGQYAELNEYGQYKVQLLYDKTAKPVNKGSCYIRMASINAGSKNGIHFPLLKGTEVLLAFIGGNPDQPVIIGAVANSENANVVNNSLHTNNRILTQGGNQVVMNDQKGKEMISLSTPQAATAIMMGNFPKIPAA